MKSDSPEVKALKAKFGPGELTAAQREELRLAEIAAAKGPQRKSSISGLMNALSSPVPKAPSGSPESAGATLPQMPAPKVPQIDVNAAEGKMPHSTASPLKPKP